MCQNASNSGKEELERKKKKKHFLGSQLSLGEGIQIIRVTSTELLCVGVTINCSTLQLNRLLTASSQSLSSFSTCSIAFSASLYRYNTHRVSELILMLNAFSVDYLLDYKLLQACTNLHAHEGTALAEVSFGPVWGQLNGAFSICQGLRILLQAVIAIRAIPKESTRH